MLLAAIPMASANPDLTVNLICDGVGLPDTTAPQATVKLETSAAEDGSPTATAEWTTDPDAATYGYVAKLWQDGSTTDHYAYVRVYPATTVTWTDIAPTPNLGVTFEYYFDGDPAAALPPSLELYFEDPDSDGWAEITIIGSSAGWSTTNEEWQPTGDITLATGGVVAFGKDASGEEVSSVNALGNVIGYFDDEGFDNWVLTRVTPQIGWQDTEGEVYIDNVVIGSDTYDLEPSGNVDDKVTVSGTCTTPGGLIQVYWDSVKDWDGTAGLLAEDYAVSTSYSIEITIPEADHRTHYVIVKDVEANEIESAPLIVEPKIVLDPSAGIVGDTITVDGTGFDKTTPTSSTSVDMSLIGVEGEAVGIGDGDTESFDLAYIAKEDTVKVYVDGVLTTDYTISDDITIAFNSAPASGAVITADYTFSSEESLMISPSGLKTSSLGSFTATFTIPSTLRDGTYTVEASAGVSATAKLKVGTVITLTPKTGLPGTEVTVSGRGFAPSSTVDVLWLFTSDSWLVVVDDQPTDSNGAFSATFTVPTAPCDDYTVKAVDTEDETVYATATFTVTGVTKITLTSKSGPPGISVTVKGEWFTKGRTVTVYFDGTAVGTGTVTFTSPYTFEVTYIIPDDTAYGAHTFKAVDSAGVEASATFTVTERLTIIKTRSTEYLQGDVVSFYVNSTEEFKSEGDGYEAITISIIDPNGYRYGTIDLVPVEADGVWIVPYSNSTVSLSSDAALGLWNWTATYNLEGVAVEQTAKGNFTVVERPTLATILGRLDAMEATITGVITDSEGDLTAVINSKAGTITTKLDALNPKLQGLEDLGVVIATDIDDIQLTLDALDIDALGLKIDSIQGDVAYIKSNIGDITTSVDSLGAKVTSLSGDVATVSTKLGDLQGTVTSIDGKTATVKTDVGDIKADVSDILAKPEVDITPVWIAVVLSLIAAIAAIFAVVTIRQKIAG